MRFILSLCLVLVALPVMGAESTHGDLSTEHGVIESKVDGVQMAVDTLEALILNVQDSVDTLSDLEPLPCIDSPLGFTFPGDGVTGAPLRYQADAADQDNGGGLTFTDLNTSLMWEVKVVGGDGSATCLTALHGVDSACTWDQMTGDWINAVNAEMYGGYNDWRAPTVKELQSLVDYSAFRPTVNPGLPGATAASGYWSSTPAAVQFLEAWLVKFDVGSADRSSVLNNPERVRAVRDGP